MNIRTGLLLTYAFSATLSTSAAYGQDSTEDSFARFHNELKSESARKLLTEQKITPLTDPDIIPGPIKLAFNKNIDEHGLAAPGETFQSGCVRRGNTPGTRLILAGSHPPYYFIAYEQGGFALHTRLALFKPNTKGAQYLGSKSLPFTEGGKFLTLSLIVQQLKAMEAAPQKNRED